MTRKIVGLFMLFCLVAVCLLRAKTTETYFYEKIANPSGKVNFVFGFYPEKYTWKESQSSSYTTIPAAVVNDKSADSLQWNDYKVFIMLRDGTLFRNYTTTAKSGRYLCKYPVNPGETHYQDFAFAKKFKPAQILHVWLELKHNNFIKLKMKI